MSLPSNWALIPVTGTYTNLDGTPTVGRIYFISKQIVVIGDQKIIPLIQWVDLVAGKVPAGFVLASTNDPDLNITGWAYTVREGIPNGSPDYAIFVPYNAGSIDLATVSPVVPPPALVSTQGQSVATVTTADFVQPAVGANVTVSVGATSVMVAGTGQFIAGGGYYIVASVIDATHVSLTNIGADNQSAPGTDIAAGAQVTAAGIPGDLSESAQSAVASAIAAAAAAEVSVQLAANQVASATTQAGNASTSAIAAAQSATAAGQSLSLVTQQVNLGAQQVTLAAGQVTLATAQVGLATTQANLASASATTAGGQAGIATTQAAASQVSAGNAAISATNAATAAPKQVFATVSAGLAATPNQMYFAVANLTSLTTDFYLNNAGTSVYGYSEPTNANYVSLANGLAPLVAGITYKTSTEYELSGQVQAKFDLSYWLSETENNGLRTVYIALNQIGNASFNFINMLQSQRGDYVEKYFPNGEYELSGWSQAQVDASFYILTGVTADYSGYYFHGAWLYGGPNAAAGITTQLLGGQTINYLNAAEYELSGKIEGVVDQNFFLDAPYLTPQPAATLPVAVLPMQIVDGSGNQQIVAANRNTGTEIQISSAGSNNFNPVLQPDGAVTWTTDRANAAPRNLYSAYPGKPEYPVLPYRQLIGCGDSITAQGYLQYTGTSLGIPMWNFGNSGDTSIAIASRLHAIPELYAVVGGSIPATVTAVTVINQQGNNGSNDKFGGAGQSILGALAGVPGTLTWDGVSVMTFTRTTAGSVAPITGNVSWLTNLVPSNNVVNGQPAGQTLPTYDQMIWVMLYGRNNFSSLERVLADLIASVNTLKAYTKRFVVCCPTNLQSEILGTGGHSNAIALRNEIIAQWPSNYVDVRQVLVNAYNPSIPSDVQAYANDIPATSLIQSDGIHPNEAGKVIMAASITAFIQSKGW